MRNNKGITITSLIVTIIVMVILAGIALLFSVGDSGVISRAEKMQFLEDLKLYKEEFELYKGEKQIQNQKDNKPLNYEIVNLNEWNYQRIIENKYVPSMKNEYNGKVVIDNGDLSFVDTGDNTEEVEMARTAGLKIVSEDVIIAVEIEGEGTVEGLPIEGNTKRGAQVSLKAIPGQKQIEDKVVVYTFAGWYENGKLVEQNLEYIFRIGGNTNLVAKFITNVTIIYYSENGEEKILLDENTVLSGYTNRTDINKVEIGTNCTKIAAKTFQGCSNLISISLPSTLTSIENYTFENCSNLELITLPESLTKIGTNAFYNCQKIKITEIPEKVTSIGVDAFNGCTGLEQVTTSSNNSILLNKGAFSNCTGLETLIISNMTWGERWDSSFISKCTNLKDLQLGSLGKPMSTVYKYSLSGCTRNDLTIKVFVGSGVTSISFAPFGATNATVEYYDATTGKIVGESLGKRYTGTDVSFTEIPNAEVITEIRAGAFEGCTNLALTSLPFNLVTIGEKAFYGCTNIKIRQIPEKVTSIGVDAFNGCTGLEQVTTSPNNSILLNKGAFSNCTGLETLIISNMTWGERWDSSFISKCTNLKDLQLGSLGKPMSTVYKYSLSGCTRNDLTVKVFVESGVTSISFAPFGATNATVEYYDATTGVITGESLGKRYTGTDANFTKIPNADVITEIRAGAFEGCTNLALTSLPKNLTAIGSAAFKGCINLKITEIPEKVTTIGVDAFNGCTGLEQVTTSPNNSILLNKGAFANCTGLNKLTISNMTWGERWDSLFISNCYNLKDLQLGSLGKPMSTVYKYSLSNSGRDAEKLTITVYLEDGVTSVGNAPFGAKNATVIYKNGTTGEVIE